MSTALDWAWEQPIPSTPKFVLVALADHANAKDFTCYPSIERLAKRCMLHVRTIKHAIGDLVHRKLVARIGQSKFGTTIYKLLVGVAHDHPVAQDHGGAGYQMGVAHDHPNSHLNLEEETRERETAPAPDEKPAEPAPLITVGRLVFTVSQHEDLKLQLGARFASVLDSVNDYARDHPIDNPYVLALRWSVPPPQPEPRIQEQPVRVFVNAEGGVHGQRISRAEERERGNAEAADRAGERVFEIARRRLPH